MRLPPLADRLALHLSISAHLCRCMMGLQPFTALRILGEARQAEVLHVPTTHRRGEKFATTRSVFNFFGHRVRCHMRAGAC